MQLLELPEQTPSDEIDEEILEIFIEEAEEVLEEAVNSFTAWRDNPSDKESLQTLRRNFHTLKGSGRLVGAMVIGELGWRFEDMLNHVIDGTIQPSQAMFSLIEQIPAVLPSMIEHFKTGATTHLTSSTFK